MKIALATLVLLTIPRLAMACPVCFGGPDSAQTKAAQAGILALLGGDGRHALVDRWVLFHLSAPADQDVRRVERRELLDV